METEGERQREREREGGKQGETDRQIGGTDRHTETHR